MTSYDLIVIGGGPAGSTLATLTAMAGHRVLLLEKEQFPRYQIGESLLPATVQQLASLLGIRDKIRNAGFVVKRGATFSWGVESGSLWTLNFGRVPPDLAELPPDTPHAYNVPRHKFDELLLDNAKEKGVDVRHLHTVASLIEEDGRVCGVRFADETGEAHEARATFVAVTTGQIALPERVLGPREYSIFFKKVAVFGYYEGAGRLAFPLDGNTFFETSGDTWLWYIPLSRDITSIGAVIPAREMAAVKADPEAAWHRYISGAPVISGMLRGARRATTDPFTPIRLRAEYSYCRTKFWSPGVVAIGDAACFVDVLLSSGVHLATYGALLAARSINSILAGTIDEAHAMNEYEARLRLEYGIFYRGLIGLYDMTHNSDAYAVWLRTLLQDTNGVYIELREQSWSVSASGAATEAARAAAAVEAMRAYNAEQVRYAGGAGMFDNPPPPIAFTLSSSSDWLRWAKPLPTHVSVLAPSAADERTFAPRAVPTT